MERGIQAFLRSKRIREDIGEISSEDPILNAKWMVRYVNDPNELNTFYISSLDEIESKIHIGFNTKAIIDFNNLIVTIQE